MKFIRFLFTFILTVALIVGLNEKWGDIPPLGKFFDPYNGFWANAENKDLNFTTPTDLSFVSQPVSIYYDSLLLPHIYANTSEDLYAAQGFVTAQNRLWQMEFQTMASAGRVSEIIGKQGLNFDRYQRRNGLLYGAEKAVKEMEKDEEISALVNAYTSGVNAYIDNLTYKDLPLEYKLLDYRPEEWSPLKTALLLKYMANNLAGRDYDIENTKLLKLLGKERFNFFFPDRYENMDPVIPAGTEWDFTPEPVNRPDSISFPLVFPEKEGPQPNAANGSNNWAIAGSKTNTGKPILANDPHLGLNLPSIWYVMHLNGPNTNVMGATLPGALGVISGFNDNISWGVTNATRDVRDWYYIEFKDKDKNEYRFDGKWLKTQKVVQTFKIRGAKDFKDTIYYTHHGPIVYDEKYNSENAKANFALRWTALDPSNEQRTFIELNKAHNYNDYVSALSHFQSPAQNFVFASTDGDIALWVNGKFPLRWEEQGKFIMDGRRSDMDWAGFIPHEQNAHIKNPERGFVSSANQVPVDSTYPYYHYDTYYEHYRNRRINNQLSTLQNITIEDVKRLQNDNYNVMAFEILPAMLDSLDRASMSEPEKQAFNLLKNWNYIHSAETKAAPYFEVWWSKMYNMLWDEFDKDDTPSRKPEWPVTVAFLKKHWDDSYVDVQDTEKRETITSLYNSTFTAAVDSVENWKKENEAREFSWANFKNTTLLHLARLQAFSTDNIQIGGGRHIVNATSGRHGASWRMIVSMETPVKAYAVYPGGQSGNPGSYYYDNLVEAWSNGEYYVLQHPDEASQLKGIISKQELSPNQE